MKAADTWRESKFVRRRGRLRASADSSEVGPGSWFIADRLAGLYEAALAEHARGALLDLSAGKVPLYGAYRDLVDDVVCTDWSASLHGARHIDVEADLNEALPFPDARFDTILCSDVLEHVRDPRAVMKEMARCLRPGGTLILGVPFYYWLHEQPHDYFRYTEYGLRMLAEEADLDVTSLDATGGSPEIAVDLLSKHLSPLGPVARATGRAGGWLCRTPPGRAMSRLTARRFPLGYLMVARR